MEGLRSCLEVRGGPEGLLGVGWPEVFWLPALHDAECKKPPEGRQAAHLSSTDRPMVATAAAIALSVCADVQQSRCDGSIPLDLCFVGHQSICDGLSHLRRGAVADELVVLGCWPPLW